jgi:hypothetical protein
MKKRPTNLKALFLLKVFYQKLMRFIRWAIFGVVSQSGFRCGLS